MSNLKDWRFLLIVAMHLGLLLLPVGAHATVLTIEVGQHQTWLGNSRTEANPTDTASPLTGSFLSVYAEADWPIYTADGNVPFDFQLVYDPRSTLATPEAPTWLMLISGVVFLSVFTKNRARRSATQS
jgi:hypothetical protein